VEIQTGIFGRMELSAKDKTKTETLALNYSFAKIACTVSTLSQFSIPSIPFPINLILDPAANISFLYTDESAWDTSDVSYYFFFRNNYSKLALP